MANLFDTLRLLVKAWKGTAEICLKHSHDPDSGLSPEARAVFAGRSDAYANCADMFDLVLSLMEQGDATGELRIKYTETEKALERHMEPPK